MTKKVSYLDLLKEAITEYDASQLDYKGPLINPMLTFDGSVELKSNEPSADVASVLERYYYKEQAEEGLAVPEDEKNEVKTGENPDTIAATKADIEKEITEETPGAAKDKVTDATTESEDVGPEAKTAGGDEGSETGAQAGLEIGKNEDEAKDADIVAASEQAVIEKLIEEMEADSLQEDVPGGLGAIGKSKEAERDYKLEQAFSIFKEQIETLEEEAKEKDEEPEEELDVDEELPEEEAEDEIGEDLPDKKVNEAEEAEEDEEEEAPEEEDEDEEVSSKEVVA